MYKNSSPILPFFLVLICPIFAFFEYETAYIVFIVVNALACCFMPFFLGAKKIKEYFFILIFIVYSFPVFYCFGMGQVCIVLALAFSISIWFVRRQKDLLTGVAAFWLFIKPHLFVSYFIYLTYIIFKEKRFKIVYGGLLMLVIYGTLITIINPNCFMDWYNNFHNFPRVSIVSANNYLYSFSQNSLWIRLCGTFIINVAFLCFLVRTKGRLGMLNYVFLGMPLNAIVLPYGCFFDLVCVIPSACYVLLRSFEMKGGIRYLLYGLSLVSFLFFLSSFIGTLACTAYPALASVVLVVAMVVIIKHDKNGVSSELIE